MWPYVGHSQQPTQRITRPSDPHRVAQFFSAGLKPLYRPSCQQQNIRGERGRSVTEVSAAPTYNRTQGNSQCQLKQLKLMMQRRPTHQPCGGSSQPAHPKQQAQPSPPPGTIFWSSNDDNEPMSQLTNYSTEDAASRAYSQSSSLFCGGFWTFVLYECRRIILRPCSLLLVRCRRVRLVHVYNNNGVIVEFYRSMWSMRTDKSTGA